MKTLVEHMLPARFLTQYAIYMQSCAHLELAIWQIVVTLKHASSARKVTFAEMLAIKQRTRPMIAEFKEVIPRAPYWLIPAMHALHSRIIAGIVNRNLAAHGAFSLDHTTEKLSVAHYWQDYTSKEWLEVAAPISYRQISEAVDEADYILKEAVRIRHEIWLKPAPPKFEMIIQTASSSAALRIVRSYER